MPSSREVIQKLEAAGWRLDRIKGSHHIYVHPDRPHPIPVPHPKKDLRRGTVRSIERAAGIPLW